VADVTVKGFDDFDTAFGGGMLKVRSGLGVSSFGIQVIRFPANADQYPEHDHSHDGQEEVYAVVEGRVTLIVGDESHELDSRTLARVGPGEKRKLVTGDEPAVVLAIGAMPGKAYEIADFTN
jgi:mannose-6-phosphate isomerase-like protein (cupin superfamily)